MKKTHTKSNTTTNPKNIKTQSNPQQKMKMIIIIMKTHTRSSIKEIKTYVTQHRRRRSESQNKRRGETRIVFIWLPTKRGA